MQTSITTETTTGATLAGSRKIVFVAGSGRSGTSTLSGILQQLGMHVPQPEVAPDQTNPKGFGESRWVVDYHSSLLKQARVQVSDARPQAWFDAGKLAVREENRQRLASWLTSQFSEGNELVIKDPRLAWFLGLWRVAAIRTQADVCFVTMLRAPTEVVGSKHTYYHRYANHGRRAFIDGITAWMNMMLHTERATRELRRTFVRYDDLLDDWITPVSQISDHLSLQIVNNARAQQIRKVHNFIDPSLRRIQTTWDDLEVPRHLRDLATDTWEHLNHLAEPTGDAAKTHHELDLIMEEYVRFYEDSEAVAKSSIFAAKQRATADAMRKVQQSHLHPSHPTGRKRPRLRAVANLFPHRIRATIPPRIRQKIWTAIKLIQRGRK